MNPDILFSHPLAQYTTLQVGGNAAAFTAVRTEEELEAAVIYARKEGLPITVLGAGSNILVSDEGISGLVIKIEIDGHRVSDETADQVVLEVGAGEMLDEIVSYAVSKGWWGIENLSHIPSSVGAVPVQNVGAYGVEAKDVVSTVKVYDTQENSYRLLTNEECSFGYRDSVFKHSNGRYIIVQVTFILHKKPNPLIAYRDLHELFAETSPSLADIRSAIISIRSKKFPDWRTVGTAGSFFKNPVISQTQCDSLLQRYPTLPHFVVADDLVKIPLGFVLDKILNLRGSVAGNVGCYQGQALVLVTYDGATATEVETYAQKIADLVKAELAISIEWEVTKIA